MSKLLKKERIIAKSFSGISAKTSAKPAKKQNSFEHNSTNNNGSILTTDKQLPQPITDEVFVSPVKSSIKVKMKVKISGKVPPIPVDSEDVVFLDE